MAAIGKFLLGKDFIKNNNKTVFTSKRKLDSDKIVAQSGQN